MGHEKWFKTHTNDSNFETAFSKTIQTIKPSYQFCDNCKIPSYTIFGQKAELKIAVCPF